MPCSNLICPLHTHLSQNLCGARTCSIIFSTPNQESGIDDGEAAEEEEAAEQEEEAAEEEEDAAVDTESDDDDSEATP